MLKLQKIAFLFLINVFSLSSYLISSCHAQAVPGHLPFSTEGIKLNATISEDQILLNVSSVRRFSSKVFALKTPGRIVADLTGLSFKKNYIFKPASHSLNSIRTGTHGDKLRLVLDFPSDTAPGFSFEQKNSYDFKLVINFKPAMDSKLTIVTEKKELTEQKKTQKPKEVPEIKAEKPEPTPSPVPEKEAENIISTPSILKTSRKYIIIAKKDAVDIKEKKAQQEEITVIEPEQRIPNSWEGQIIEDFKFDYLPGNRPVIIFKTRKQPKLSLTRIEKTVYQMRLRNCKVAREQLLLPYFPPFDFEGFRLVRMTEKKNDTIVTIEVDPGIRLSALPEKDQINVQTDIGYN